LGIARTGATQKCQDRTDRNQYNAIRLTAKPSGLKTNITVWGPSYITAVARLALRQLGFLVYDILVLSIAFTFTEEHDVGLYFLLQLQ